MPHTVLDDQALVAWDEVLSAPDAAREFILLELPVQAPHGIQGLQ